MVELEEGGPSAAQSRSRGWSAIFTSCFSHRGGGVLDPGHINKAMEEFLDSAWRGQRTTEERETLGERRRTPRGRSPILLPLDLVDFNKRKGRV